MKAFQDYYPDHLAHCFGCGRLNAHGYRIKTFWEGERSITRFLPEAHHTAVPGLVYGGLLASLIDCHSTGTAAAAMYRREGREMDTLPAFRFVTALLQVHYRMPTPLGCLLEIRSETLRIEGRKVLVDSVVLAEGRETVRGEVACVLMPEHFGLGSGKD